MSDHHGKLYGLGDERRRHEVTEDEMELRVRVAEEREQAAARALDVAQLDVDQVRGSSRRRQRRSHTPA
jgi:hypothetical protein